MIQIRDIKVYLTAPDGQNLVVVRVDTSEPGLYGLGCASFAYRAFAVKDVIERYFKPLLVGRDVSRIEDTWKLLHLNGYWRNGPIDSNALSGIDMALWDIKGKLAKMPLYDLLGGKCRDRVDVYLHCNAGSKEEVHEKAARAIESGCKYIRAAYTGYDAPGESQYLCLANDCKYYDPKKHRFNIVDLLGSLRAKYGNEIEMMTDTHSRLDATDAIKLAKALEELDLFFMEDPVAPEDLSWLRRLRSQCTTPVAIGEVFTHSFEWMPIINEKLTDFIRCHLSAIGGLTPARKVAAVAEANGVKTAWHGSLDMSPIAMAVNTHLGFASPNFGIQEYYGYVHTNDVFPGAPEYRDGALWLNEAPGHGVEFDEKAAAAFPPHEKPTKWTEMRLLDGTLHTP